MASVTETRPSVHPTIHRLESAALHLTLAAADIPVSVLPLKRLQKFGSSVRSFAIPGLGMFCEAYFIFAIGNLKPIWKVEYPECWETYTECPKSLDNSINYTQVGGIIFGQLVLGFTADRIGRRLASIITACIMLVGGILITASDGPSVYDLFIMFTVSQCIFGVGVGGEYPVASTSANERAEGTHSLAKRRGETVVCVFSMQGWGNLINTIVIVLLMVITGQNNEPYDDTSLEIVWRLSYGLGIIPLLFIVYWRLWRLRESTVWMGKRKALQQLNRHSTTVQRKLKVLLKHYWHRVLGTSICWMVWDFTFYGNKLFQGTFIKIINPTASLLEVLLWTILNSSVALVGYYFAAFTIDKPWMGRKRMQFGGFLAVGIMYLMCAIFFDQLIQPSLIQVFQLLYYFATFAGQWGPNSTTFLLAAEIAPTEVRSMSHGFSAAMGKIGALMAGILFGLVSDRLKFGLCAICGLFGAFMTLLFIPDITGLDLREGDKRWLAIIDESSHVYVGEAINPKYLSVVERMLGYHKAWRPADSGFISGEELSSTDASRTSCSYHMGNNSHDKSRLSIQQSVCN